MLRCAERRFEVLEPSELDFQGIIGRYFRWEEEVGVKRSGSRDGEVDSGSALIVCQVRREIRQSKRLRYMYNSMSESQVWIVE